MLQKVVICGVDTSGLPLLSSAEQDELMKKLKGGDRAARDKFIVGNMRLVLSLVRRFWAKNANADDVFQAGCVGLIKAIDNFDLSVGVKFSTYAVPTILALRNSEKECKMTRKQAFLAVIKAFLAKNDKLTADKLQEVMGLMPFVKWTEESIKDCIEQFMFDNGRVPTATDFGKMGLPPHPVIKNIFKMTLHTYIEKNFPEYYKPALTYRQALQRAIGINPNSKCAKLIKDVLNEYPLTKWTATVINDGIENFIRENGRVPTKKDFAKEKTLPYIDLFRAKFDCTYLQWLKIYFEEEYNQYVNFNKKRSKSSSLEDFKAEFDRVKPLSAADFNHRRNATKISCAEVIMRNNNISGWHQLLSVCGCDEIKPIRQKPKFKLTVIII